MGKVSKYTTEFKLSAINWHNQHGGSLHRTAKHFGIDRKRIREWLQSEHILQANSAGQSRYRIRNRQGNLSSYIISDVIHLFLCSDLDVAGYIQMIMYIHQIAVPPKCQQLDNEVLEFLLDERLAGRPVSNEDLQLKARDIAQGIPGMEDFKGSDGWLFRWKAKCHWSSKGNERKSAPS